MKSVIQPLIDACAYNNAYMLTFISRAPKRFQNRLILAMAKDDYEEFYNLIERPEVRDKMDEAYYGYLCNEAKSKWGW